MLDSRLSTALRSAQLHSVSLDLPQQEMTFPASCHYTEPNVSSTFGTKELAHASPTFCMQLSFTRVQFDDNVYSALSPVWSFVRFQWSLCAPRIGYIYMLAWMFLPSHFNTSGGCSLEDSHLSSSYSLLGIFPLDFLPLFFIVFCPAKLMFYLTSPQCHCCKEEERRAGPTIPPDSERTTIPLLTWFTKTQL